MYYKFEIIKVSREDEISPRILKITVDSTSKALGQIFNRSLMHGEIPDDWKSANVVPIFKKGSKGNKNNYRPVNLTSVILLLLVLLTWPFKHLLASNFYI